MYPSRLFVIAPLSCGMLACVDPGPAPPPDVNDAPDLALVPAASTHRLVMSKRADRSAAGPLAGQIVRGDIYPYISPATGVVQVRFFLDGSVAHTEHAPPFDFAGTAPGGAAKPFDTRALAGGTHHVRAEIDRCASGCTEVVRAAFEVDNEVAHAKQFGVAMHWPAPATDLGAAWVRQDFTWALHQPTENGPLVGYKDDYVIAAQAAGAQVVAIIWDPPPWAQDLACKGVQHCKPRSADEYGAWAGAMARHYKDVGPTHARVAAYELWNEENSDFFWKPTPDPVLYAQMVIAAYDAIKAEDPSAIVILGGTSGAPDYIPGPGAHVTDPRRWLASLYANRIHGHFDAVVHHPYTHSHPNAPVDTVDNWTLMYQDETISGELALSLRTQMRAAGDAHLPIWATEYGSPAPFDTIDEAKQASLMTQAMNTWKTYPWAGTMVIYNFKDTDSTSSQRGDHMGLIYSNIATSPGCTAGGAPTGAAKMSYCAFARYPK